MIRHALISDVHRIEEIYNQGIELKFVTARQEPMGLAARTEWLSERSDSHPVIVFEQGDFVVGYAALDYYRKGRASLDKTAVISYFVDQQCWNKGIGSKLIEAMLSEARKQKLHVLIAIIIEGNDPSIALLKKFQFKQWAYLPNVFQAYGKTLGQVYMGIEL